MEEVMLPVLFEGKTCILTHLSGWEMGIPPHNETIGDVVYTCASTGAVKGYNLAYITAFITSAIFLSVWTLTYYLHLIECVWSYKFLE